MKRISAVPTGTQPNNALEAIIAHNENDEYEKVLDRKKTGFA